MKVYILITMFLKVLNRELIRPFLCEYVQKHFILNLNIIISKTEEGVICEMKTHSFGCEEEMVISISAANYGRTSKTTCRHPFDIESLHNDTDCHAPTSLSVMRTLCNQRRMCTVTVNGKLFGKDPCYGTYKYLEFDYTCVKPIGKHVNQFIIPPLRFREFHWLMANNQKTLLLWTYNMS